MLARNNGYLELEHLSNIELYYSEPGNFSPDLAVISGDEFLHITKVMRHKIGDEVYVTNGLGKIYSTELISISKSEVRLRIKKEYNYENRFNNITFCIPKLKSHERFEFALEKGVELGVTNFIIYESIRAVAKGSKIERWKKITLSAMKQSLRSYLPVVDEIKSLNEIAEMDSEIILFEQYSAKNIKDLKIKRDKKYTFVFGPEGGLDQKELDLVSNGQIYNLAENRLRSETAIINAVSILAVLLQ
jgi:16S rRNA (uracil1498-N3)-methyltransferase